MKMMREKPGQTLPSCFFLSLFPLKLPHARNEGFG